MTRALDAADLALLVRLHAACFDDRWDAQALAALLAMPGAFGLLSQAEDGFVLLRTVAAEGEIIALGVVPSSRRRGIARILLSTAVEAANRRGAERIYLEVACDNLPARALYSNAGFQEVGRRRDYYVRAGGSVDALVLARDVGRPAEHRGMQASRQQ